MSASKQSARFSAFFFVNYEVCLLPIGGYDESGENEWHVARIIFIKRHVNLRQATIECFEALETAGPLPPDEIIDDLLIK